MRRENEAIPSDKYLAKSAGYIVVLETSYSYSSAIQHLCVEWTGNEEINAYDES